MPTSPVRSLIEHICRAVPPEGDGELLGRFVERRDERALAALVDAGLGALVAVGAEAAFGAAGSLPSRVETPNVPYVVAGYGYTCESTSRTPNWSCDYGAPYGPAGTPITTVYPGSRTMHIQSLRRPAQPFFRSGKPPVLVYTNTPFRGLLILLVAFPLIRAAIPGCRLRVFSSMGVYQWEPDSDVLYRTLYALARDLPGVEYLGSVSQTALADALAEADMLAYPNVFPETSCIAVMEAMAAGCLVCTTNMGALPETTAGFGFLMDLPTDILKMMQAFAELVIDVHRKAGEAPGRFEDAIARQRAHIHAHCTWGVRAREWVSALQRLPR